MYEGSLVIFQTTYEVKLREVIPSIGLGTDWALLVLKLILWQRDVTIDVFSLQVLVFRS